MNFYSWKDIDRYCRLKCREWTDYASAIEAYPSELIVYRKAHATQTVTQGMSQLFGEKYDKKSKCIHMDIGNLVLPITEQEEEISIEDHVVPLFKEVLYHSTSYPKKQLPPLKKPVIAFHSYKGGVGRTLSLIAFAKAWAAAFAGKNDARLLIVDADIEAPGLTWIQDTPAEDTLSYLDLLTLIQDNTNIEQIVDLACSKLKTSIIPVETTTQTIEHVFLPAYRYEEQLFDLYATPETIVNRKDSEYVLAQVLSKICQKLGLGAVLVDLRAGISEYSSTLLLDSRVKKYLVTSTSTQSIMGTQIVLKYLTKGLSIQEDTALPEVLLNMVPDNLPENEKAGIIAGLHVYYDQGQAEIDSLTDNVVTELPFASELIHLSSLSQILRKLDDRGIYLKLLKLIKSNFDEGAVNDGEIINEDIRQETLERVNKLAENQISAESNVKFELLMTEPLKYLKRKYDGTIPTAVIMGAKGSGKTFLYRKMIDRNNWNGFCADLSKQKCETQDGFFLPVIATKNNNELIQMIKSCVDNLNDSIEDVHAISTGFLDNSDRLEKQKELETDWQEFWETLLVSTLDKDLRSFQEANEQLEKSGKKVVFLIDGLEEILQQVDRQKQEQKAVQVLCQDIVTKLIARYHNLGIIVFLRRDMALASITVNFAQFEQAHQQAELKWSSSEALKLAVWLVNQAEPSFYKDKVGIEAASEAVIQEHLCRLWGKKLGKTTSNEAYSSRWILAALSDFNGQLQARDIIRFLCYAAVPGRKTVYNDRYIMPAEVKAAVSTCSTQKMEEIKQEYAALRPIFEKLETLPDDQKKLPLDSNHANLSAQEEKLMISEGFLKRDGDKYYLPEITRHALGFKYERGARPKVLSLTLKR